MTVLFQIGGGSGFWQLIWSMEEMGFFLFLFPFLLALAIVYGVLRYSLPDAIPKPATALISIIIAFFVMLYSSFNTMVAQFFMNLSGMGLIAGCGILIIVILLGLMGIKTEDITKNSVAKWSFVFTLIFIGIIIFFGAGAGWLIQVPYWSTTSEFWAAIFFVVILALVMWFFSREGEAEEKGKQTPS